MEQWLALHSQYAGPESLPMLGVLTVAVVGTAALAGLAVAAFVRRRSQPYLLVVGAFVALFARSVVAALTVAGAVSPARHHLLEHGLDVALVALVVAAVYHARTVTRTHDRNH